MAYKFNPFTGNLDIAGSGSARLTEYDDSDKPSPSAGDAWVKHTTTGGGKPVGLLLALTEPGGGTEKWELSYQSVTSGIKRVEIT